MATNRMELVSTVLNRAFALTDYNVQNNYEKQHEFRKQIILADESLTNNEKLEAIKRSTKNLDIFKLQDNKGTKRICENCKDECLATLYCEHCIRNYLKANFSNWTSGNNDIDNLIKNCQMETIDPEKIVEWIPYNKLKNVKYLTKGGFSEIYTADWIDGSYGEWDSKEKQLKRFGKHQVILKRLENVESANKSWLEEGKSHMTIFIKYGMIAECFGLTKDPSSNGDYALVMSYYNMNLRDYLQQNHNKLTWKERIEIVGSIIDALYRIHDENSIHRDLHSGNILYHQIGQFFRVSDLGFCGPADKPLNSIYGNLPYIAPEVIAGKETTFASDIYSFGILMWEISSGQPPFINYENDYDLAIRIINGMRPRIIPGTLLEYEQLMKQCWDADPTKRPEINILDDKITDLRTYLNQNIIGESKMETNNINETSTNNNDTSTSRLFTSKVHRFGKFPEPRNANEEEQEAFHSNPYSFSIPDSIDDLNKNISKSSNIFKDTGKELSEIFKKIQINSNSNEEAERQIKKNNIINDEDEICNNPNFHQEQVEFEIPDKSFTIKFYKIDNLDAPTIISCNDNHEIDEIRKLGSPPVSYSLAVSNLIRIGEDEDDALIAVSCFCNEDMMKQDDDFSLEHRNLDIEEKGEKGNKNDALLKTFVISKNSERIQTKVNARGVVKFLDDRLEKGVGQSIEFTNLIVMNASGITKALINNNSRSLSITKEYEFPIIIQDNFNKDIPCTRLLQNSITSNYLFAEDYTRNKKVEMYNLKSLDLEIVFKKRGETSPSTSLLENPIFSISNHGHLLAHCSNAKNITIYLMENGLEVVTKEFSNADTIHLVSFINDDEKLFVVTEEANDLMINIWDLFTFKSDIRKVVDNTNILNSSLAISNGIILASSQDGNVFSVLDRPDVKRILKPSDELTNLLPINVEKAQQNNLLESHSEPWVNCEQRDYSYLDEKNKTIQLIIGKTTVQVWKKRNNGKQVLKYIRANLSNEEIKVKVESCDGNCEFFLDLSSHSTNSADGLMPRTDQSQKKIKIHWPNETHILKDACEAIKYLYERKYEVRRKNQNKYEKLVIDTEKIIKKCIKKNPDLWRLSETRYEIMTNLIQAKRILLLHQILFDCKKMDANSNIKVSRYLHIPRQYSWPVEEKKSDLEIAIEESSDEEKAIVAMLLDYYSNNAEENIGLMFTVTKAIPSLLKKRHLESYLKELFYKPCFGAKQEYLNSKFVSKFVSQNELKKGYNKKVYPLNIKVQLLEKQDDKHLWWNVMKNKLGIIDNDGSTHHATTALFMVPLPDFTVYPINAIKSQNSSILLILLKLFKLIFWPKSYLSLRNQHSPFLKFLDINEKKNILYDNPAIEACIELKWNKSRNHFLRQLLKFIIFSALFFVYFSNIFSDLLSDLSIFLLEIILLCIGYHLLVAEVVQFINEGKKYLNIYNIFDVASISISMPIIILRMASYDIKVIASSFATLILCLEFLLLLRMFSCIANYINIVTNILKAALPFMGFMLFITFAFGSMMHRLDHDSGKHVDDMDNSPVPGLVYSYLGKWVQTDSLYYWPVFLLSIIASIILIIVMQNLLIAVMTNIYEEAKSNARLVALKYRGELISDYEKTEKLFPRKERENQRYIYYIGNSDFQEEWLKKAKEFRESHRSLLVENISNQLLLTEYNSNSDDDSDDDDDYSNGEKVTTKNVARENDNNVEEHSNNNHIYEKFLKLQEEMKKMQNDVTERLHFEEERHSVEERFNSVKESLKEILSFVKKST